MENSWLFPINSRASVDLELTGPKNRYNSPSCSNEIPIWCGFARIGGKCLCIDFLSQQSTWTRIISLLICCLLQLQTIIITNESVWFRNELHRGLAVCVAHLITVSFLCSDEPCVASHLNDSELLSYFMPSSCFRPRFHPGWTSAHLGLQRWLASL